MTVITSSQFRANQGKYIGMAHRGEDVYLKTRRGSVILTPVADDIDGDKVTFQKYVNSPSFLAKAKKVEQEHKEGKTLRFNTIEELRSHLDSL